MTSSGPSKVATLPGTLQVNSISKAGVKEILLWLLKRRIRFEIRGASMDPLLMPTDEVLIAPRAQVEEGDVVVLRHPYRKDVTLVKGIKSIDDAGLMRVQGLNADESTDSRSFGAVSKSLIIGKVTAWVAKGKETTS
jgi:nickel-type superoxide dismutase maturation protease